ncbi:hypothetical protein BH24ACT15_BH24ACT15_17540 [soil metagenome]
MTAAVRILLISGSTRSGSTNTAVLRTAQATAPHGVTAVVYDRLAALPAFNPDDDHDPLPGVVASLREEIAVAHGVLFCVPEYAGALPGSFKNLLDWTVGGPEMYGKPVAWINVSPEGRGELAQTSLSTVLDYLGAAVIEPACGRLFVPRDAVGPDGVVSDVELRGKIAAVLRMVVKHLRPTAREDDRMDASSDRVPGGSQSIGDG